MTPLLRKQDVESSMVVVHDRDVSAMVADAAFVQGNNGYALHEILKAMAGYNAANFVAGFIVANPQLSPQCQAQLTQAAQQWDAAGVAGVAHGMQVAVEQAAGELNFPL